MQRIIVNRPPPYLLLAVTIFLSLLLSSRGTSLSDVAEAGKVRRLLYVAVPGIRNYLEYGGHGLLVFDMDNGHRFVKRIPTAGLNADGKPDNVKGVCASAATKRIYISALRKLQCLDLVTEKILWEKSYEGGCDRMAISPDGKVVYLPSLEGDHWHIVDALTGDVITKVIPKSGAHNTVCGLDGKYVYLAGLKSPLLNVLDAQTRSIIRAVGPFSNVIRPFTVNGRGTLCFVNVNDLLGFEVGDLITGKMLHRVEVQGFQKGPVKRHGCPSHGVGLTPDEKELWLTDAHNQRLHIFDATVMPPKQVTSIALKDQPGWVTFSLDGRYAYPSTGDVIDVATRRIVAELKDENGVSVQSEKMMEVDFRNGVPIRTGDQFGVGRLIAERGEENVKKAAIHVKMIDGPFQPTWASLENYKVPKWYLDAKFGIFIHWGAYCVPAFGNEWYPRNMYQQNSVEFKHHVATYGAQDKFGYKDFIPMFKAEKFDAQQWATLFKKSGAKFVVPVAEHHDGFAMYDTALSEWCAAKMGPKRDIVGELAKAVRKEGMIFGVSSHRAEHWWFFDGGMKFDSDVKDPRYAGLYGPAQPNNTQPDEAFLDDWLARCCELVDKYKPQLFWFDWWIEQPAFEPYRRKFAAYYYNRSAQWRRGVAINYKNDAFPAKAAVLDIERGQLGAIRPQFWQTDTSISKNSWGYVTKQDYKTAGSIIGDLVDIVSKNGALLLNIGPKPDGTIPDEEQKILLDVGKWLEVNGEAIYGTRPWLVYSEGPTQVVAGSFSDTKRKEFTGEDFRFTTRGDTLYAIALALPSEQAVIKSLATNSGLFDGKVTGVSLLGHKGKLKWTQDETGLKVQMPAKKPCEHACTLKITTQKKYHADKG